MKRAMVLAAFLGSLAFSAPLFAQDEQKPAETPKEEPKEETKEEAKPARPERKRMDRTALQELGRVMRTLDADKDGKVNGDELGDEELFKKLDKDEDGFLTVQEMLADKDAVVASVEKREAEAMKEEFGILDRDDSGKLNREELGTDFAGLLESGDKDKDGELNLEEFNEARKAAAKAEKERPQRGNIMEQVDKDGDGKISKEEAPERLKENFDKLDKDGDGFITQDELKAARPQRQRPNRQAPEGEKKEEAPKGESEKEDEF